MSQTDISEPGLYHDTTFETYRKIPALNQSTLKLLDPDIGGTPLHARAAFKGELERDDSEALRLGRLEHLWIVEGEAEFRRRTVIAPTYCEGEVKSKGGIRCDNKPKFLAGDGKWFCGTHAKNIEVTEPADYCTDSDVSRIRAMAEAVRSHPIQQHLARPGWSECVGVWDVPVKVGYRTCPHCNGFEHPRRFNTRHGTFWCWRCRKPMEVPKVASVTVELRHKCRLDRLADPHKDQPHLIVDLKRMQSMAGSREAREKCIKAYFWDLQAAMYTEFVRIHFGVERCHWTWVFCEEKPPHDVTYIPASADTLAVGADKLNRYRKLWALCQFTNIWPGYCVGNQQPGGLPERYIEFYRKQYGDSDGALSGENKSLYGDVEAA